VGSLAYCAQEVEAARDRWERALSLGTEEGLDPLKALADFADRLESAEGLGPRGRAAAQAVARELRERAGEPGVAELEPWLAGQEKRLLDALAQDDGESASSALAARVDEALAPYRDRMPARVLDQIRRDSIARRRLEAHELPRLSLFHLEGRPGADGGGAER
jgi:hypothetical protein